MSSKQKDKNGKIKKQQGEQQENDLVKDSIGDLLKEFGYGSIQQYGKDKNQKNYDDEKYDYLKKQLKNSSSQNKKLFMDDDKDVFSFSKKEQKNEPSYYNQDQKNIFFDESQDQSSMFQKKQKMNQNLIEQIEEDSDLFNKDDSQDEDEDDKSTQMFSTKRTDDFMCFQNPSKDDSELQNQINTKEDLLEKLSNPKPQPINNDFLLGEFDDKDGKIFSFSKEANQFCSPQEKIEYFQFFELFYYFLYLIFLQKIIFFFLSNFKDISSVTYFFQNESLYFISNFLVNFLFVLGFFLKIFNIINVKIFDEDLMYHIILKLYFSIQFSFFVDFVLINFQKQYLTFELLYIQQLQFKFNIKNQNFYFVKVFILN